MKSLLSMRRHIVTILAGVILAMPASPATAANLPPGGAVIPTATPPPPGTLVRDAFIPFMITDAGGSVLMQGTINDQVIRENDGTHTFMRRVRDVLVNSEGEITALSMTNYGGVLVDAGWDTSGPAGHVPDLATRSSNGVDVTFSFASSPIHETESSVFCYADTDAFGWDVTGDLTISLGTGENTVVEVASPIGSDLPPDAEIISPTPFECVCDPATITGIADDPNGLFDNFRLEYRGAFDPNWTLIGQSFVPVPAPGGFLFQWSTLGLPQGYYFLRLTVENTLGLSTAVVTVVWVDQQFDVLSLTQPQSGLVYGGIICPGGILDDHCGEEYRVLYSDGGPFQPIDPNVPLYFGAKINQTFATWDTIGNAIPDGPYTVQVEATDPCGHGAIAATDIIVDNTPPTAIISSPVNCECVEGLVEVVGIASDANLESWVLQYTGGNVNTWVTIASGTNSVLGVLGTWDTTNLLDCPHTLRLVVTDSAIIDCNGAINQTSIYTVSVDVGCTGCAGDLNGDGAVNTVDLLQLLGMWGLCP